MQALPGVIFLFSVGSTSDSFYIAYKKKDAAMIASALQEVYQRLPLKLALL
jgi:hypothetical protein